MGRRGRKRTRPARQIDRPVAPIAPREDIAAVVLAARQRHYALTPEQSRSEHAGHVLGVLWLRGLITEAERDAGYRYEAILRDYSRSLLAPSVPSAGDLDRHGGASGEPDSGYEEWTRCVRSAWEACDRALRRLEPLARSAVDITIRGDMAAPAFGLALRQGLRALAETLHVGERS